MTSNYEFDLDAFLNGMQDEGDDSSFGKSASDKFFSQSEPSRAHNFQTPRREYSNHVKRPSDVEFFFKRVVSQLDSLKSSLGSVRFELPHFNGFVKKSSERFSNVDLSALEEKKSEFYDFMKSKQTKKVGLASASVAVVAALFLGTPLKNAPSYIAGQIQERATSNAIERSFDVTETFELTDALVQERDQRILNSYADEAVYHLLMVDEKPDYVDQDSWDILQAAKSYSQSEYERTNGRDRRDLRYLAAAILIAPEYNSENPAQEVLRYARKASIESSFFSVRDLQARGSTAAAPTMFIPDTANAIMRRDLEDMPEMVQLRFDQVVAPYHRRGDFYSRSSEFRMDLFGSPVMQFEYNDHDIDGLIESAYRRYQRERPNMSAREREFLDPYFTDDARFYHEYAAHMLSSSYQFFARDLINNPFSGAAARQMWLDQGQDSLFFFQASGGNADFYTIRDGEGLDGSGLNIEDEYINARYCQTSTYSPAFRRNSSGNRYCSLTAAFNIFERNNPEWLDQVVWRTPAETMRIIASNADRKNRSFDEMIRSGNTGNAANYDIATHLPGLLDASNEENVPYQIVKSNLDTGVNLFAFDATSGHFNFPLRQVPFMGSVQEVALSSDRSGPNQPLIFRQ